MEFNAGSVLVGPLGSRLWRGTEQERSATALSVISVLGICFSVAVFPFIYGKLHENYGFLIHKIPVFLN
jgi:hypothetical protein